MIQKPIQQLLTKPMNRREFLAHVGAGALTVVGVSGLIKNLLHYSGSGSGIHRASGYGATSYGGSTVRR